MSDDLQAEIYYEAHITIEPVFDARREEASKIAVVWGFKLADLLMKKREVDTEERSSKDTFMTGHGKSLDDIKYRTKSAVISLQSQGFKVWRYKIEDTILDSRHKDAFGLLTPKAEPKCKECNDAVCGGTKVFMGAKCDGIPF